MRRAVEKAVEARPETKSMLLEAAKDVLHKNGLAGLSTREVALTAGVPLSQIHYHFGSKQGLVLALFEYMNEQLLERQQFLFGDTTLKLSEQWDRACDYLEEDFESGYVRVLQEMIAAGFADPAIAKVISAGINGWVELIAGLARRAARELMPLGPFSPEEVAALVANAFIGAESLHLVGLEQHGPPVRRSLRRFGELIRMAEARARNG